MSADFFKGRRQTCPLSIRSVRPSGSRRRSLSRSSTTPRAVKFASPNEKRSSTKAWVIGILLPHSVVNVCTIYVGAMLIFFHYSLSWTREEVLELVSPAADVGPEGIDHPLLCSTCFFLFNVCLSMGIILICNTIYVGGAPILHRCSTRWKWPSRTPYESSLWEHRATKC